MKYLLATFVLASSFLVGWLLSPIFVPQVIAGGRVVEGNRIWSTAAATSTLTFLSSSAVASSTSPALDIIGSERFSVRLCATASSSAATLLYQIFMSDDEAANKTWYQETDSSDVSGIVTHLPVTHSLNLATTTTNYICTDVLTDPANSKYLQVKYGVTGANASAWFTVNNQVGI